MVAGKPADTTEPAKGPFDHSARGLVDRCSGIGAPTRWAVGKTKAPIRSRAFYHGALATCTLATTDEPE